MWTLFGIPVALIIMFLIAGGFGFCVWCKKWTEGEFGYVADVEHGSDGQPLHGFWLQWSRVWEMIGTPLCYPLNKLLGRMK